MKYLLLTLLSSCSLVGDIKCFSIDGKASSWCKREYRANKLCKNHKGIASLSFGESICRDGKKVKVD